MSLVHEHGKPPHLKLPNFEPLPPDKFMNRVINNLLKPIFYLLFTLITSIIVIPVYTIFMNLNSRGRSRRGEQQSSSSGYTMNGRSVDTQPGRLQDFLSSYGSSYDGSSSKARRARR